MNIKEHMSKKNKEANTGTVDTGIFTASVLTYCGYKLVDNCLKETRYESNPYKNVQD